MKTRKSRRCNALDRRQIVFAVLLCVVAGVFGVQAARAQDLNPDRIHEIEGMLAPQPSGFGVPCSDRAAWAGKAAGVQGAVAQAEQALATPLAPFDPDAYLQFTKTGDRQPMERNLHSRSGQLAPLVLAECAEYQDRFLPRIAEVLDSLAAQPSWTLSAHDPQLLNLHGVRYYVDLNAADMSDSMAEALYLLGDKIPAATRKHVTGEMEKHVFGPMRDSYLSGNVSAENHNGHWWLVADMNWNAVCLKGVTGAALAMLPTVDDRALFVAGAEHFIQHYENGFAEDGYDTEGLGYWNYGFSHFIELRENLLRATGGKIDLLSGEKMQRVALFGLQFPMLPNNSAAYGDAGTMPRADAHLVAAIDHIFELPPQAPPTGESEQRGTLNSAALDLFPDRRRPARFAGCAGAQPAIAAHLLRRHRHSGFARRSGAGLCCDHQGRRQHHAQPQRHWLVCHWHGSSAAGRRAGRTAFLHRRNLRAAPAGFEAAQLLRPSGAGDRRQPAARRDESKGERHVARVL